MRFFKAVIVFVSAIAAVFLIAYMMASPERPVPMTAAEDPSVPRVTINGATFHSETFGDTSKPVVIVIHGGPGWDYRSLLPLKRLSDDFRVVFYDQRGTGLSPRAGSKGLTLDSTLEDLDGFVDYFGNGRRVNLVGHSWGAMLASGYIGRHPEKVRRAVLAEPGFLTTEMMDAAKVRFGPRWEAGFLLRAAKAWFESLRVNGPDEDAATDYFMGQIGPHANPEYYCNGAVPETGLSYWRPGAQAMFSIMSSDMDERGRLHIDLVKGVDRFKETVLFMASECNTLTGKEHQARQMKFFPKAELVVIKGSGHMMFGERPDESVEAVRRYLKAR